MTERRGPQARIDAPTLAELKALDVEIYARRTQIFRNHLARTIRLASPLLVDACEPKELDDAAWRAKPGWDWPNGREQRVMVRGWSTASRHRFRKRTQAFNELTGETFEVLDQLALRIGRSSVHMSLSIGSVCIMTSNRGGFLMLPGLIETEHRQGLIGATLDRLIRIPITAQRPYSIISIAPSPKAGTTLVRFEAAPVEWWVPWARPWDVPF